MDTKQKNFAQMLRDRRAFVTGNNTYMGAIGKKAQGGVGGGNPAGASQPDMMQALSSLLTPEQQQYLNNRLSYTNSQEGNLKGIINQQQQDTQHPVNPVAAMSDLSQFVGSNQNRMDSLLTNLLSANVASQNANTNQAQVYGSLGQGQQGQNRADFQAGYNGNAAPNAGDTGNGYSPQAVQHLIDTGASDLFPPGQDAAKQLQTFGDIQKAGGLSSYRLQNKAAQPKDLPATVGSTNDTLYKINYIQNQLKNSKSLQNALDNPMLHALLSSNNQFVDSSILKLSPKDKQALGYMTSLNAINDRAAVGGRIGEQLLQMIGPSSVSRNQKSNTNLEMLSNAKQMILNNLKDTYVTPYGYSSIHDLPGLKVGNVQMQGPDGKVYEFDGQQASQALKHGYKEVQ